MFEAVVFLEKGKSHELQQVAAAGSGFNEKWEDVSG